MESSRYGPLLRLILTQFSKFDPFAALKGAGRYILDFVAWNPLWRKVFFWCISTGATIFLSGLAFTAHAGPLSLMGGLIESVRQGGTFFYEKVGTENSQNMEILEASWNRDPRLPRGGGEIAVIDGTALLADSSPSRGRDALVRPESDQIAVYVVRQGDTLSEIGEMFGVSVNTIRWANDIPKNGSIAPGDKLVILPVTGVRYAIKKGDTMESVAKKYQGDPDEIAEYNGLSGRELALGETILIPNGVIPAPTPIPGNRPSSRLPSSAGGGISVAVSADGYYIRPVVGVKTQGIHGYNGIDFGASSGTQVVAAAGGEVVISRSGWNGGYGNYIVIKHTNGTQTLYAHLSERQVAAGLQVSQGQAIARSGNSGRSTGPHLHFEVRGARNPF